MSLGLSVIQYGMLKRLGPGGLITIIQWAYNWVGGGVGSYK